MEILKKGSKGELVKQLQTSLGLVADGIFGSGTESAVKKYQMANGLFPDGVVGPKTLDKITRALDSDYTSKNIITNVPLIEDHFLPPTEYLNGAYNNEYIVLHHTAGHDSPIQVVDCWAKDTLGRIATEFVIGGQNSTSGRKTFDGKIVRSFPEGNQGYHIGKCLSKYMPTHSVGIEICNIGWVKDGKSYVGSKVLPEQIVTLKEPFRGYSQWHRYSDEQIKSLKNLLLYISKRDNIDLHTGLYQWIKKEGVKAFDYKIEADNGNVKGLITHGNIRKDKFDLFPQEEVIDMILSL